MIYNHVIISPAQCPLIFPRPLITSGENRPQPLGLRSPEYLDASVLQSSSIVSAVTGFMRVVSNLKV